MTSRVHKQISVTCDLSNTVPAFGLINSRAGEAIDFKNIQRRYAFQSYTFILISTSCSVSHRHRRVLIHQLVSTRCIVFIFVVFSYFQRLSNLFISVTVNACLWRFISSFDTQRCHRQLFTCKSPLRCVYFRSTRPQPAVSGYVMLCYTAVDARWVIYEVKNLKCGSRRWTAEGLVVKFRCLQSF